MISDERLQELIGWHPHPKQLDILVNDNREVVISAGRRFGKSAICAYLALKMLLQDNKRIWIVAPTYDLTGKVFDYLVRWFAKVAPSQREGISYRPYPRIKTARGSILECRSTENPTGLLGEEVDLEIVDEAARIPRHVYDTYLYPVTSSRKGRIISISTPFGKNHFYEKWMRAKEEGAAFKFSSREGVSIDDEEWENMRRKLPEHIFKQEYMAEFLEDAASVFRNVYALVQENCLEEPRLDRRYIIGVDLAKVNDFSVVTVVDTFSHRVVAFERYNEVDYVLQKLRIIALARRYNNARVIMDVGGVGRVMSDEMRAGGLVVEEFKFTNASKKELIEKLSLYIDAKGISLPANEILLDELSAYGYEMTDSGNMTYSAPQGTHDDCVISLALAVWGLANPKKDNPAFLPAKKSKKVSFEYT